MHKLFRFGSVVILALAVSAVAQAGPLVSGTISFAFGTLGALTATGAGPGSSAPGPGAITLGATPFAAFEGNPVITPTAAAPISGGWASIVAPTSCSFTGTPVGGSCGLGGTVNFSVAASPFLIIPLAGAGIGGRIAFGPYGSYIDFQPWRAGAASVTINGAQLTTGNATTPGVGISMLGYDNRTALGGGSVKLVAPGGLMSTLGGPFPLFISMTLAFVPEPGTLLLLGSAIVGLGLNGRKKQKNA
ncbi:MAG: PEP-CTERM sorting domain-containing protein [bacterium]|nr:PEP-CTERM sorting domain-containing protein [bacterium]MCP5068412.1 PEP-CTERM sorting domain-containing protein [bacterium]